MINALVTAIRTLSVIPIPGSDTSDFARATVWFPFVGFLLALPVFFFIKLGMYLTTWRQLIAVLSVLLGIFLTRGIHLDGLADCADGFGGGYTKERILSIMKDSDIGVFGALALISVLALKYIAFDEIIHRDILFLIIPSYISSRFTMSYLSFAMKYARKKEGTARRFVQNATLKDVLLAFSISFVLNAAVAKTVGVAMLFISFSVAFVLKMFYAKKIGGVTGDVLGATSEIVETILLIAGVLLCQGHLPY